MPIEQPLPSWDLTSLYLNADDPQWEADLRRSLEQASAFRAAWYGQLAPPALTAQRLAVALAEQEDFQRRLLKALCYAQLLFAADSGSERHKAMQDRARAAHAELSEATLFFELDLLRLPADDFAALLSDPLLAPWRHHLELLRAHAPYTLSEEVEQALRRKDLSGKEAFVQLFEEVTGALLFRFQLPGEPAPREVTGEELLALLYHPQAAVREHAFTTFLEGHAAQSLVLTSCFNNLLLDHGREAELRGYPDLMTPSLLAAECDAAAVERLMAVTEAHYPLAREYFALKARLLGVERLKNSDLYAPLGTAGRSFTFAEAEALVLEAFTGFAPELATQANAFFLERRIDAAPRPGKSSGAFCQGMLPGYPPYLLVNFTGTLRDVSTLAHELGHGIHYASSGGQRLCHYHAPLPLAETASVFAEMLLTRHLLRRETDRGTRIALLCAKLEEIIATTFRQNVLTRFEQAAHRARGTGLLSADDYGTLWWEENQRLFGDTVEMIPAYRWGWSYISHFVHARFYCFSYIFGELLTLALFRRYEETGVTFVPLYLDLLRQGGSQPPAELLAPLGIDLNDPAFWEQGYALVRALLDELRRELDAA